MLAQVRLEFYRERDELWAKMSCRSIVCRRLCDEVWVMRPSAPLCLL